MPVIQPSSRRRRRLFSILTAGLSILLAALAAEVILRARGLAPIQCNDRYELHHRPDPTLGWDHVPGVFTVQGAKTTFLEDSSRSTGGQRPAQGNRALIFVGGSYAEGYGVDDKDTFAWKIQERFPERLVVNFATSGYGTLQSLLTMEEQLPRLREEGVVPEIVVYGFHAHHFVRNVATHGWRRTLSEHSCAMKDLIHIPYALVDTEGELRRFPPTPWPLGRLGRGSAIVALITDRFVALATRGRSKQAREVCLATLKEMNRYARQNGADFLLVSLSRGFNFGYLRENLPKLGIPFIDCTHRRERSSELVDPRTRHPTPLLHAYYADCIGRFLASSLERLENVEEKPS